MQSSLQQVGISFAEVVSSTYLYGQCMFRMEILLVKDGRVRSKHSTGDTFRESTNIKKE